MELRQQDMMVPTCDSGESRGVKWPLLTHKLLKLPLCLQLFPDLTQTHKLSVSFSRTDTVNIIETKDETAPSLLRIQHTRSDEWLNGSACSGRYNKKTRIK